MAVKNYEMDSLLAASAMREFLQFGYQEASLRRIAEGAGTTTGSVYMRYESKDALFCSLTACVIQEAEGAFRELRPLYEASRVPEEIMGAVEAEACRILEILFTHYDAATLLLCKSEGSSVAGFFEELTRRKVEESAAFFSPLPLREDERRALELLLTVQFDLYRQILKKGYTQAQAQNAMQITMKFMEAGWQAMLPELLETKGGNEP